MELSLWIESASNERNLVGDPEPGKCYRLVQLRSSKARMPVRTTIFLFKCQQP